MSPASVADELYSRKLQRYATRWPIAGSKHLIGSPKLWPMQYDICSARLCLLLYMFQLSWIWNIYNDPPERWGANNPAEQQWRASVRCNSPIITTTTAAAIIIYIAGCVNCKLQIANPAPNVTVLCVNTQQWRHATAASPVAGWRASLPSWLVHLRVREPARLSKARAQSWRAATRQRRKAQPKLQPKRKQQTSARATRAPSKHELSEEIVTLKCKQVYN